MSTESTSSSTGAGKRRRKPTAQPALFGGALPLKTLVIARRADFTSLFEGFTVMRAISYVASPDLLLEFLDDLGYQRIEIVVGENLSASYKKDLQEKGVATAARLAALVEEGRLRILVPQRTVHSKLYLLEGAWEGGYVRLVQTSANLTATAREASRQVNYAWFLDVAPDDPVVALVTRDYQAQATQCSLFMEDLTTLLRERPEMPREEVVEVWLRGGAADEEETEAAKVFAQLAESVSISAGPLEEQVVTLTLTDRPATRKRVDRMLAPMEPSFAGNQAHVNGARYVRYVNETHGVPFLRVNVDRNEVLLGLDGLANVAEAPPDRGAVDAALAHLEEYLNTVERGQTLDPGFAKMAMYEALLYIFAAPFFHEYMKRRRDAFGMADRRGPPYLYIYGPTQNGKSTFLRFALSLLTGRPTEPLSRDSFTKTKIANAAMVGTAFPLVFDDVQSVQQPGIEDVFKSLWERWWSHERVTPQLVITSNTFRLREWAKSRTKRVDFDVHFAPTERDKANLNRLFREPNPIYRWFAHAYMDVMKAEELPSDDALRLARKAMLRLYERAGREVPNFFPREPLEKTYDPGLRDWRDLLFVLKKAIRRTEGKRALIEFDSTFQTWELSDYQSHLPQTVKCQRHGHILTVDNPAEFDRWLGSPEPRRGLLGRWLRR